MQPMQLRRSQLTVDELTFYIQGLFASDITLKSVVVSGEISEFKKHTSGHCYFTLLGEESRVACAIFKQYAGFVPQWPNNGDKVLVEGSVGLYAQRGVYQFYARRLVPVGAGAIERARQELQERLEKEGLFSPDLKRSLPPYPRKVAVITSETGAAALDVIQVARRRYPSCEIVLVGAQVQGADAAADIVRAFSRVAAIPRLDGALLVRGGGSREDLVPFDDEDVVRAVRSCPVPVVSGVGHDIDTTLCDLAADLRASTPSAAAELVFPDRTEIVQQLLEVRDRMEYAVRRRIAECSSQLDHAQSMAVSRMGRHLSSCGASLDTARKRLRSSFDLRFAEARKALAVRAASLEALSPLAVMARGFVTCEREGERLRSAQSVSKGERVKICFPDGGVEAKVEKVNLKK
ncbi:MAG: exodeoxyribonuclease VII large subunit [Synergistaceae bacterium]|jgi:exodeoxyribonuclease VII large subunit|nr:exodeoxyribonuclease VII large subunit [Synergistaceae bacterium]